MLEQIKYLLKHSFIYGISNVASKASGIILLPLYTSYFSVEEYGRLGLILIIIIIFSQSLILGQNLSIIRYSNTENFKSRIGSILFTILFLVISIIVLFIFVSKLFLIQISGLFGEVTLYKDFLNIAIYIIAFTTLNNLLLGKLRADDESIMFTSSSIIKVIVVVALSIYLIVQKGFKIEGVLYAQLAGEISQSLMVLPKIIRQMKIKLESSVIVESLKFGIPLIFSAMAINLLNGSDRFIIKFFSGDKELGLYELGYRVAGVINMFVIMPFGLTVMPLAYKLYKQPNDKEYYKKLKTYVAFFLVWSGLALSLFGKEIVEIFAQQESYYPAYSVVSLIILAYIIYGISMISSFGMYLTGNNGFVAVITLFAAALNIGLNFWLVPLYGMMGAAINTVIAFAVLDILSNIASNKYYKINYEYFKIFRLFLIGGAFFIVSIYLGNFNLYWRVVIKLSLILMFPFVISISKYFEPKEISAITGAIKKWKNPLKWKTNLDIEKSDSNTNNFNKS
jgi:O-antigen/teichoic acid export membrane protein